MVALPPRPGDWATPTPTAALGGLRPRGSLPTHLSLRCSPVLLRPCVTMSVCPVLSPVSLLPPFCSQACALRRSPDGPPSSDPARLMWGPPPCHPPGTHGYPKWRCRPRATKAPWLPSPPAPSCGRPGAHCPGQFQPPSCLWLWGKAVGLASPPGEPVLWHGWVRGGQVPPEHHCWGRRNHRGRALGGRDAAHGTFWVGTALQKYNVPHMISFCLSFSLFKNKNSSVLFSFLGCFVFSVLIFLAGS